MCKIAKKFKQEVNKNKGLIDTNFLNQLSPTQQDHLLTVLRGRSL